MPYPIIRFAIKYRYALLGLLLAVTVVGVGLYIRHIQDKIAITKAELENQRIQQEALAKALSTKEKNNAKTKTTDFNGLVSIHAYNGWLRND